MYHWFPSNSSADQSSASTDHHQNLPLVRSRASLQFQLAITTDYDTSPPPPPRHYPQQPSQNQQLLSPNHKTHDLAIKLLIFTTIKLNSPQNSHLPTMLMLHLRTVTLMCNPNITKDDMQCLVLPLNILLVPAALGPFTLFTKSEVRQHLRAETMSTCRTVPVTQHSRF